MEKDQERPSFIKCSNCKFQWDSVLQFMDDPETVFRGFQTHFKKNRIGYLVFNHRKCKTTMNIPIKKFKELDPHKRFDDNFCDTGNCPGCCYGDGKSIVDPLSVQSCKHVRELLKIADEWPANKR